MVIVIMTTHQQLDYEWLKNKLEREHAVLVIK